MALLQSAGINGTFVRSMVESLAELKLMSHSRGWRAESEAYGHHVLSHIPVLLLKLSLVL